MKRALQCVAVKKAIFKTNAVDVLMRSPNCWTTKAAQWDKESSQCVILHINITTTPDGCIQHIITTSSGYLRSITSCWYLWWFNLLSFFSSCPDSWGCICAWLAGWRGGRWDTRPATLRSSVETATWAWWSIKNLWTRAASTTPTATGSKVLWQHSLCVQTALQSSECIQFNTQTQTGCLYWLFHFYYLFHHLFFQLMD